MGDRYQVLTQNSAKLFENINYKLQPSAKLRRFLQFLTFAAQNYYSEGWLSNKYWAPNAVQVMTIFQSTGLEYPVVFVPGLNKNYLPSQRFGGKSEKNFDS